MKTCPDPDPTFGLITRGPNQPQPVNPIEFVNRSVRSLLYTSVFPVRRSTKEYKGDEDGDDDGDAEKPRL